MTAANKMPKGFKPLVLAGGSAGLVLVALSLPVWAVARPSGGQIRGATFIQEMIDRSPEGGEVVVPPGHYVGHLEIAKPVILDGKGVVTIDAMGTGSVVTIRGDNATLRNLHLTNSGADHNSEDAGVQIFGNRNTIQDNLIDDTLFGVTLIKSDNNTVRGNRISSKSLELGLRGDSIKLWYSNFNRIEDNEISGSRDLILWYSRENRLSGNTAYGGRYGLHFMYAANNIVENNRFYENSVGVSMMYSMGDTLRRNYIAKSTGATGVCVSIKESSDVTVENNDILYCANGINLDLSPFEPGTKDWIVGNRIAYNDLAITFLSDWHDNYFKENRLTGNLTEVAVFGGGSARKNQWEGNAWESYEGFDTDHDGIGDTPQRIYSYAGRVWMDVPNTRFFKDTPILEVLDFLDRLAPFSEPRLLLEDRHPLMTSAREVRS